MGATIPRIQFAKNHTVTKIVLILFKGNRNRCRVNEGGLSQRCPRLFFVWKRIKIFKKWGLLQKWQGKNCILTFNFPKLHIYSHLLISNSTQTYSTSGRTHHCHALVYMWMILDLIWNLLFFVIVFLKIRKSQYV